MRLTATTALILAATTPAFAGGLADPAPDQVVAPVQMAPPAPVPAPGNWTGFYGGAQLGYGRIEADPLEDGEATGATYGLHGGYLYDFGSIVAGAEIDYEGSNISDDPTGIDFDRFARAKLRVGYDAGRFQPYLTGGAVWAQTSGALDAEDYGRFAGLGVEYKVTDRVRVGGEVLQHQFEDFDGTGLDLDATTASARVSFQF
ncbi:outer membrane protein [Roseisalinus antarcticus]|uniref:Outer membrane protein beta-barrel domain-containing protein n=1 Tax=Roseisalinus antarcticus TaxID=254357 RepID=A0A1Y5TEA7_9RHOB|nr:outer membrane beta-barrel protein [Roseisalinus antarcticus]SLN59991.1 hypothetical protein ROA7023_02766 [Roseisalinus antarcticus]